MSTAAELYLDHNASSPLLPEARTALLETLALGPGNASSAHAAGRRLRRALEDAREQVARLVDVPPAEVIFTSGATESNALALHGALAGQRRRIAQPHLLGTYADHESVAKILDALAQDGVDIERVGVDRHGRVALEDLASATRADTALITLPHADSVTGTLQPVAELCRAMAAGHALVHADAAQSAGRLPVTVPGLGVDLLTLSGHKLGAPTGIGALVVRTGTPFVPPWGTGSQERGRRPGSSAVALAAAFGAAAEWAHAHREDVGRQCARWISDLRAALDDVPGARVITPVNDALPNTCLVAFEGCPGDAIAAALDARGTRVSTGSACTSGARVPPAVLLAGGWSHAEAAGAVRISIGSDTPADALGTFLGEIREVVPRVRTALSTG